MYSAKQFMPQICEGTKKKEIINMINSAID